MPSFSLVPGRIFLFAKSEWTGRVVVAGLVASIGLGVVANAPRASAATGSAFCTEAKAELTKLSAIAKMSSTAMSARTAPATLKVQLLPFLKAYRESSLKLQRISPSNLRLAVKAYLDQGVKGLVAMEKAGWDVKKLPQRIPDPANFMATIAPLVSYAKSTCGVALIPLSQLDNGPSKSGTSKVANSGVKRGDPIELKIPACSLYSKAEAEKLIGAPMVQLEPGINGATQCTYNALKQARAR